MTGINGLPSRSGTYILVLRNRARTRIDVGSLGCCQFPRGWYLYTGSAFGPSGLAARVGRHLKSDKSCRWHIDYLTASLPVHRVWLSVCPEKLECQWAALLAQIGGVIVQARFGASDCSCPGHLFHFPRQPSFNEFRGGSSHPVRSVRTK